MNDFIIYPAIDMRRGKVVRLQQGRADAQTTYGDVPAAVARDFAEQGAEWIHVVNLDGAFGEATRNLQVLRDICKTVKIPVQFGGGLRAEKDVATALGFGAARVILGTVALRDPELVAKLTAEFGEKIVVGIDARDGMVAVEGWVETSQVTARELAKRMAGVGVQRFIYTDIARDGMLVGPDVEGTLALAREGAKVIASGGVGSLDHVRETATVGNGVDGLIIGKALYEGRFTVRQALETAKG